MTEIYTDPVTGRRVALAPHRVTERPLPRHDPRPCPFCGLPPPQVLDQEGAAYALPSPRPVLALALTQRDVGFAPGEIHLAVGAGYPESGSKNRSAVHWDMICDMQDGGKIWVDDELFYDSGEFVIL